MREYAITINFAGFIGCDEEYIVEAETKEAAIEEALEMAFDDLNVISTEVTDEW